MELTIAPSFSALSGAPPRRVPFLVYRDRIGAPSELAFLRRQYIGFTRLEPVWTGRVLLPQAPEVGSRLLRLGGAGLAGGIRRLAFRHLGVAPAIPVDGLASVVHAQFARGGALALPLARALGARLVVTLHGGDVGKDKNWSGTVLARRWPALIAATRHFVCVSAAVAEVALRRGVPATKLVVLPIGVEMPTAPPQPPPAPTYHLFVGRFVEKKGIAVIADAVRILRSAGDATPVVFVGDGPLRPLLEDLRREVAGIELAGWLPPDAVTARMAGAWSLLVPSVVAANGDAEGLPSVVPEAMAQGCAVIGSNEGGIAEAVRDGQTGLLVPPGDATALARAMARIGDSEERNRLGQAGFRAAQADLNARLQSARLEDLLTACL
jgi:colanic acid/amylovoran biosynthesis glycosyltransferase